MSLANEPESGPAVETVILAEAKSHAVITVTADDSDVEAYIRLARRYAEDRTGRVFVNQTWKEYFDTFPVQGEFNLSKSPVSSVESIKYYDADGAEQTLADTVYQTDYVSEPMRIALAENQSWPEIQSGKLNAITVEFVAGYGAAASSVPERFKMAIKLIVAHLYRLREPVIPGAKLTEVPLVNVTALLTGDKLYQF